MRPAEVEDVWRRLRAGKSRRVEGLFLSWSEMGRLSDGSISFSAPFCIVCGENGAGKSTLLKRVLDAVVREDRRSELSSHSVGEEGRIIDLRLQLGFGPGQTPQTIIDVEAVRDCLAPDDEPIRVALFDPAMHVPIVLQAIRRDANFAEVIEPVQPREFSQLELADVSFLAGREYESVRMFEIEGFSGLAVFPYFQVVVAGIGYSSEGMGFGELALLLGYWMVSRMPVGSIVLMEEPETFVSPRSQRRFADMVAKIALERNLKVVATTHSPAFASRFSEDEITLVSRTSHVVSLYNPAPRVALETRLEMLSRARQIWFVEDLLAARIAAFFSAEVSMPIDVFVAGNNDAVVAMSTSPRAYGRPDVSFVGLLDGDERAKRGALPANVGFLMSDLPPDRFICDLIVSAPRDQMAERLSVQRHQLELALASVEGQERHEALHILRSELSISLDQLVSGALRWWVSARNEESREFTAHLLLLSDESRLVRAAE